MTSDAFSKGFRPHRRQMLKLIASSAAATGLGRVANAQASREVALTAKEAAVVLKPGAAAPSFRSLESGNQSVSRFIQGEELRLSLSNELNVPIALNLHGFDGVSQAEPLLAQTPLLSGTTSKMVIPLRRPGTYFLDTRLLGDAQPLPTLLQPVIVEETNKIATDRDEILLIEDWRVDGDGRALAPGKDAGDAARVYTVNRTLDFKLDVKINQRLRLRLINGCQRAVIALKIADQEVRVMAIDGQPAEPFPARNGQLLMAPGSRADVLIDAAGAPGSISPITLFDGFKPLRIAQLAIANDAPARPAPLAPATEWPSTGLPKRLDLAGAMRTDISLGDAAPWMTPASMSANTPPLFRVKRGRTMVLAITNSSPTPATFHLHGHHFRLLDRLDDGWKPFWLDTLAFDARQIQRIAFAAEFSGNFLMETMTSQWQSLRRVQSYTVE